MSEQTNAASDAEAATFDLAADHGLTDPRSRHAWTQLLERILPPSPARIADLGCGTGSLSPLAAELGYKWDGVDFSHQLLQIAAAKPVNPNVTFRHSAPAALHWTMTTMSSWSAMCCGRCHTKQEPYERGLTSSDPEVLLSSSNAAGPPASG